MLHPFDMEITNSAPILSGLIEIIKKAGASNNIYLNSKNQTSNTEIPEASKNSFGLSEFPLPEFLKKLGIQSLTLQEDYDIAELTIHDFAILPEDATGYLWGNIKSDQLVADLTHLFQKCQSIAFSEWTSLTNASQLWLGILNDILKPLHKIDFIFYLGDPGKTLFFQIDEILYMINKFTLQGKVTLVLDEHEAISLWMVLSGELPNTSFTINTAFGLKRKCFSIFRTMNINRLLIYSVNNVILFSDEQQFIFSRRTTDLLAEIPADARDRFITGFSFGLLRQLDIQHCIALGMITSGAHNDIKNNPDPAALLLYINTWIADQIQADSNFLYQ
jgi:hypothetical protein